MNQAHVVMAAKAILELPRKSDKSVGVSRVRVTHSPLLSFGTFVGNLREKFFSFCYFT